MVWRLCRWAIALLLVGGLLIGPVPAVRAAMIYFVAPDGSDANPGTMERPFGTLQKAVYQTRPGDVIRLRGGIHWLKGGVWIGEQNSGQEGAPLIIESYPGEMAVLDGSSMTVVGDCLTIGGQYVIIRGITCQNSPRAGIVVWGGHHVEIRDSLVQQTQTAGIVAYGATRYEHGRVIAERWASHVHIEGNRVTQTNLSNRGANKGKAIWGMAVQAMRAADVTIYRNTVWQNYGEGIGCTIATHCVASQNTVHDSYNAEMYMDNATNSIFERNLVYTTRHPDHFRQPCADCPPSPAIGILLGNEVYETANPLEGNAVRNNVVFGGSLGLFYGQYICAEHRQQHPGWRCGLRHSVIVNNTFYAADREVIYIDDDHHNENIVVANNIFLQIDGRPLSRLPAVLREVHFQNNIWHGGALPNGLPSPRDFMIDPQLVLPGGNSPADYAPALGSPAINRAAVELAPGEDYYGNDRPMGGQPDIGAHERIIEPSKPD